MSLIRNAVQGDEKALIELSLKIQAHQLTDEEENAIMYPETKNSYSQYLQACVYGFGTKKIPRSKELAMPIINKLTEKNNPAISWAINLGNALHNMMPDTYPLTEVNEFKNKAARLNNPLGWWNILLDERTTSKDYLAIAAKIYDRLPVSLQAKINDKVSRFESKPDLGENKDAYLDLGEYYKNIKKHDDAYQFFLKDSLINSRGSFLQCQTYIFKATPEKIEKLLNNRLNQAKYILEGLSQYNVDPDIEKNTLKAISQRFNSALEEIKAEAELITGKLNNVRGGNYNQSNTLLVQLNNQIKTIEDRLKQQDKIIEALPETRSEKPRKL